MSSDEAGKIIDWDRVRRGAVGVTPLDEKPAKAPRKMSARRRRDVKWIHDAVVGVTICDWMTDPLQIADAMHRMLEWSTYAAEDRTAALGREVTLVEGDRYLNTTIEEAIEVMRHMQSRLSEIAAKLGTE